jgi:hypothetical protein
MPRSGPREWKKDGLSFWTDIDFMKSGHIKCTGPKEKVEAWRAAYWISYHPHGYMTREVSFVENDDGSWTMTVWRSHTCD